MGNLVSFSGQSDQPAGQPAESLEPSLLDAAQETALPTGEVAAQPVDKPLTAAEIREIIRQETLGALEAARRQTQSMTAKAEQRIQKQVEQQLALLKAANVPVDDAARAGIETAIRQQHASEEPSPDQPGQAAPDAEELDPTNLAAMALMDSLGVEVFEDDPEYQTLDQSSPKAFLASLAKAIQAKQKRSATPPNARIPVGSGTPANGISQDTDLDSLWTKAKGRR